MKCEDPKNLPPDDVDDLFGQTQQHLAQSAGGFAIIAPLDNFFQDDFSPCCTYIAMLFPMDCTQFNTS